MAELNERQLQLHELLERSLAPPAQGEAGEVLGVEEPVYTPICASIIREERLQYRFMVLFQSLVVLLALIALALLSVAAWSIGDEEAFQATVAGASMIVTGGAAAFFIAQRKDARDAHRAAQASLEKHRCRPIQS